MSLVTWPCRNVLASAPVRASLPRSERSTTKVTNERLVRLVQPRQPPLHLRGELVHHPLPRHPGLQRRPPDRGLLRAVEALEQREEPVEVEGKIVGGHVVASVRIMPLADTFQ